MSIVRLFLFAFDSGERVTTVARRLRDGVDGTGGLCGSNARLGGSEGMVGSVALAIASRILDCSAWSTDAPLDELIVWSMMPDSYPSANIWLAAKILRGTRADRLAWVRDARRETGARGNGGAGSVLLEDAAKV